MIRAAHAATGLSGSGAVTAWLSTANELASLGASLVAIVAGCFAIAVYIKRLRDKD